MNQSVAFLRHAVSRVAVLGCSVAVLGSAAEPLPIYQPKVKLADIYFHHPGAKPALKYNHDVDIVKFKGRFFAAWNANAVARRTCRASSISSASATTSSTGRRPCGMFTAEGGAENPVESDNQWQPSFINWRDETLFCAWSDFVARHVFVAVSD